MKITRSGISRVLRNAGFVVPGITGNINRSRAMLADSPQRSADYQGASHGRRLLYWNPGGSNVNALELGHGTTLRNRSRDLIRNNAWANEIVEEWTSNAVGTGIMPDFLHPDANIRKILDEGWKRFVDEADADERVDFYGLQALACQEIISGGESISRLRKRPASDGLFTPLQLQMLEPEHLPYLDVAYQQVPEGNVVRLGIEFDRNVRSRRVAYHLYREHPGAGPTAQDLAIGEITRVPAQFINHSYKIYRSGQMRGEPWLSRALAKLYQFDQFVDATLGRQKLGAFMLGWTTSSSGVLADSATDVLPGGEQAPAGTKFGSIEPETILELRPGEDLKWFDQPDISTQYESFVAAQLREIFACAGMTLEQFDVSKVNYSSIRAGTLKYRRRCEQFQFQTLVFQFCQPIAKSWMDVYVLSGAADKIADRLGVSRINPQDYYANRDLYYSIEWRTPAWQWVDPLKEVMATIAEIRAGLKPLSDAIRERGYDPNQVLQRYATDKDTLERLGLVFDTDPSKTDTKGDLADPVKLAGLMGEEPPPAQPQPTKGSNLTPKERLLVNALVQ